MCTRAEYNRRTIENPLSLALLWEYFAAAGLNRAVVQLLRTVADSCGLLRDCCKLLRLVSRLLRTVSGLFRDCCELLWTAASCFGAVGDCRGLWETAAGLLRTVVDLVSHRVNKHAVRKFDGVFNQRWGLTRYPPAHPHDLADIRGSRQHVAQDRGLEPHEKTKTRNTSNSAAKRPGLRLV
jgi:hypothetical protein